MVMPTASAISAVWQSPIGGFLASSGVGQRMDAVLGFLGGALLVLVLLAVGALVVAVVINMGARLGCAGMAAGIVVLVVGLIVGNHVAEGVGAGITFLSVLGTIIANL